MRIGDGKLKSIAKNPQHDTGSALLSSHKTFVLIIICVTFVSQNLFCLDHHLHYLRLTKPFLSWSVYRAVYKTTAAETKAASTTPYGKVASVVAGAVVTSYFLFNFIHNNFVQSPPETMSKEYKEKEHARSAERELNPEGGFGSKNPFKKWWWPNTFCER